MTESYSDVDLAYLDTDYDQTEVSESDFEPVPPGKYQVVVERIELTTAQTTGNPMLKWTLRVLNGAYDNRLIWKNSVIMPHTLEYVKRDLQTCQLFLTKLSDLKNHLNKLLDLRLEVAVRTKNDNTNVYLNRLIAASDDEYRHAADDAMSPF